MYPLFPKYPLDDDNDDDCYYFTLRTQYKLCPLKKCLNTQLLTMDAMLYSRSQGLYLFESILLSVCSASYIEMKAFHSD